MGRYTPPPITETHFFMTLIARKSAPLFSADRFSPGLIVFALYFLCAPNFAPARAETVVLASAEAKSRDEAFKEALAIAVSKGCASAVVSRDSFRDNRLVDKTLTIYSGCIVKEFEALKDEERDDGYYVSIKARVIESQALERFKRNALDAGPDMTDYLNLQGNLYTAKIRLANRPKLIGIVLDDYPEKSFKIDTGRNKTYCERIKKPMGNKWDYDEICTLTRNFEIQFDDKYLDALDEVLHLTRDAPGDKLTIVAKQSPTKSSESNESGSVIGALVELPFQITGLALEISFGLIGCLFGADACRELSEQPDSTPDGSADEQNKPQVATTSVSNVQIGRSHKFRDEGVLIQIRELMINSELALKVEIKSGGTLTKTICSKMDTAPFFAQGGLNLAILDNKVITESISIRVTDDLSRQPQFEASVVSLSDCLSVDGGAFTPDPKLSTSEVPVKASRNEAIEEWDFPTAGADGVSTASTGKTAPEIIRLPASDQYYPPASIRRQEAGRSVVRVCFGPKGEVARAPEVISSSGYPRLDAAAIRVAEAGTYKPGRFFDDPMEESCLSVSIDFGKTNIR